MWKDENGFSHLTPKTKSMSLLQKKQPENQLIFRHGHIAITNYKMGDNKDFEKSLSTFDEIYWKYRPVGFYYVKPLKELRINRGYDIQALRNFFPRHKPVIDNDAYEYDDIKIKLKVGPRDDFQRTACTFLAGEAPYEQNKKVTQILMDADTGSGKALPDDERILTLHGWRPIKDVVVGDQIYTPDMKKTTVLGIYPQNGPQDVYQLTLVDGRTVRCNIEHLWDIYTDLTIPMSSVIPTYELIQRMDAGIPCYIKMASVDHYADHHVIDISQFERRHYYYILQSVKDRTADAASFTVTSQKLAHQLVRYIRSQKYFCKMTKHDTERMYTIWLKKPETPFIQITKIEKLPIRTKQRCILVDDPSHMFIAENYVPTHNTYCGTAMTCYWRAKTVVIVPFTKLLEQWKQAFLQFSDLKEKDIMIVQGSSACKKILKGDCRDIKVFLFMVDTIASFEDQYGPMKTMDMLEATRAYLKIVDEVHLDIKAIAMVEALSNFRMNYYMSASPGRTARKENWIFKCLFYNVPRFGSKYKKQDEKHLNILIKNYRFLPDQHQLQSMINRRKKWLNTKAYETELIHAPKAQREDFDQSLIQILKWIKGNLKDGNKVLLLCNTIDGTEYLKSIADQVFPEQTSRYYGTLPSKEEKKEALKKNVICATASSLGTGADIKGLQFCVNICTYSSKIDAVQISGRLREIPGTQVVYIELVNTGWYKTLRQYEKRKDVLLSRSRTGKLIVVD